MTHLCAGCGDEVQVGEKFSDARDERGKITLRCEECSEDGARQRKMTAARRWAIEYHNSQKN